MTRTQAFYSFHFKKNSFRTGQIRNIEVIKGETLSPSLRTVGSVFYNAKQWLFLREGKDN